MKSMFIKLLLFFFLLLSSPAFAENDPLSGLLIENGRVSGMAKARVTLGTELEAEYDVKVDFPLPPPAYPQEILTITQRFASKKQMQSALKAAGQSTNGKFVNPRGTASFVGDWNAKASSDISKEAATEQAIQIALKYFGALGIELDPVPYQVSRPYDYNAYMDRQLCYYEHRFSDASSFMENSKAGWKRREKHHPKQSEYTSIDFYVLVDGMRLNSFTSYPAGYADEPDAWIGFYTNAHAIVSDSGVLVEASCPLYEIKKKRPLENDQSYTEYLQLLNTQHDNVIPGEDWTNSLSVYLNSLRFVPFSDDQPYQNQYMTEPVTQYGSRTVVTEIHPVLHTISEYDWAPFWKIEIKNEYKDGWRD